MKRFCIYIISVLSVIALAEGCADRNEYNPDSSLNGYISAYCQIESNGDGTKALIDQTTNTDSLFCNFLRIDNTSKSNPWNNVDWTDSYVSEGSVSTSAPGSDPFLRTISLHPPQPYHSEEEIVSRMVGWYPRNIDLPEDVNNEDISTKASNFSSTIVKEEDYTGVKFTGLNGSTDIMVSNVLDGSVNDPFDSEKFFKFKHYLSAVKIYAKAENSSQDISIWGDISNVIIMGQPTSCEISIPETAGNDSFGEVKKWGTENAKLPITTSPIFGPFDIGNHNNIEAEEYPISLDGGNAEKYLGYSLIKPVVKDNDVLRIQIHTSAGVYEVNINEDFQAGYLYELHLDFKTDNTIHSYMSIIGNEKYFNLTTLEASQPDPESSATYTYKYANCYIVFSDPSGTEQDPDGDGGTGTYDGFCFDATVVGNGEKGIISEGAQHMYPTHTNIKPFSADILWETSSRLISQVELIYGYIRFKVAKNNDGTFKEGNAVLVAYDENKNILWSWHIWITDKPKEITYTEGTTSITILDRNIGATAARWDGSDAVRSGTPLETYGLYYQWGRKDPSMGPPEWDYSPINMTTAPYYDYSSEVYHAANVMRFESPTLKDGVENPMYLIMPTSQTKTYYFNWLGDKIDFLWGYNSEKGTTQKTIYDPCPYGYRVSGGELADLFSYATSTTQNDIDITRTDYGQIVNISTDKFYFPYTGFKGVDRGLNSLVSSWRYVGQKGDYQSSIVSTYATDEEYFMHRSRVYISKERTWNELNVKDYIGYQIFDHTNRRTAAPVRCVKNEEHNRVMAFITPDTQYIVNSSDEIKFTLYAQSFQTNISSATLSVGYHLKSDEEEHLEMEISKWEPGTKEWSQPYTFKFSNLKDSEGNTIELNSTTGQFRFILHVKSEDNINKTSSTTITLLENDLIFQRWNTMDSTVFADENIDRQVRIIGVTKPIKVEMIRVMPDHTELDPIDITSGLSPNSSPEYPVDYLCSTEGLSFSNKGWNYVYFRVTYESGNVVTYNTEKRHKKWFKVVSLTQITNTSAITDGSDYVIRNNNTNGYLYDNGNRIAPSSTISYNKLFFFNFENTGSGYKIKNKSTGDYVRKDDNTLNMSETNQNNATTFSLTVNGNLFRIGNEESSYWGGSISYWWVFQRANSAEVSSRNQTNRRDWIIYLVDDSDIGELPSS